MRAASLVLLTVCVAAAGCAAPDAREAPGPSLGSLGSRGSLGSLEAEVAARAVHTMTPLPDGSLLVAGGCVVDGCDTASAATFLVSASAVTRGPPLAGPRDGHTATALADGRVLVTGGFTAEGTAPLGSAEVFDPASSRWSTVGSMAVGRGGHAAARLGDGRVLVAGGWLGPRRSTATTEVFDPSTGRFSAGPSLPTAVDGLAAASLGDGCVLVVGGQSQPGVATPTAVTVCPDLRVDPVGGLATARFKHGIVTLSTGEVVVVGGTTDDRTLLASTEIYDPGSRSFRSGPELRSARYKLGGSLAVLPDDRVVVAGGGSGVEVLDLRGGSRLLATAGPGWASFSTVGVTGSRVFVVGGYDEQIRLTHTFTALDVASL
jgi:galactose oxidase-like protein/Kelch motif protein